VALEGLVAVATEQLRQLQPLEVERLTLAVAVAVKVELMVLAHLALVVTVAPAS